MFVQAIRNGKSVKDKYPYFLWTHNVLQKIVIPPSPPQLSATWAGRRPDIDLLGSVLAVTGSQTIQSQSGMPEGEFGSKTESSKPVFLGPKWSPCYIFGSILSIKTVKYRCVSRITKKFSSLYDHVGVLIMWPWWSRNYVTMVEP